LAPFRQLGRLDVIAFWASQAKRLMRKCIHVVAGAGICNKIRKLIRALAHIVFVKNSFRQPSKKAWHAVF
jgi:hypothetical protein